MKKVVIVLAIILFAGNMTRSYAQKSRTLSKGFSLNFIIGFPSGTYGLKSDSNIDDKSKFVAIGGLQIGNRWYFSPTKKIGLGLMVNWIDFSVAYRSVTDVDADWNRLVADFSFCEFGPVGTVAITDNIALDLYYNIRPTILTRITSVSYNYPELNDEEVYSGIGYSHALGTAFRYKELNVGFEYVFGSIKCSDIDNESGNRDSKLMVNNFRIKLGWKF